MRNYVALAVRGIRITDTGESGQASYGWLQTDEHIQQAEQRVFDGIELAGRKLHISPQRVFLPASMAAERWPCDWRSAIPTALPA